MGDPINKLLDRELNQLDKEICWSKNQKDELKARVKSNIQYIENSNDQKRWYSHSYPLFAVAFIIMISFILFKNIDIASNKDNSYDSNLATTDLTMYISKEEQNVIENKEFIYLTKEATIASHLSSIQIMDEPKRSASKDKESILGSVEYTLNDGSGITIQAKHNEQISGFNDLYPNAKKEREWTINQNPALLVKSEEELHLMIKRGEFLYIISGEQDEAVLISIANEIEFKED